MLAMVITAPTGRIQLLAGLVLAIAMIATVGTTLAFQHVWGYIPCLLCIEQRSPYYIAIPIALVAAVSAALSWPAVITRGLLLAIALFMTWSIYLAGFHSGVEWGWWQGPADCGVVAGFTATGGAGILDALDSAVPPSCDEAAGRFLGLSFAGWNFVASVGLAAIAYLAAFHRA